MTGQVGRDPAGCGEPHDDDDRGEFGNAGTGAASALEQMKWQHERRHRRLHGGKGVMPRREHEGDREQ